MIGFSTIITEFIDFGDFKVFESAGIQTMIYFMQKSDDNSNYLFNFSKIKDKNIAINEIYSFLSKQYSPKTEIYKARLIKNKSINNILNFPNETNNILLEKIEKKGDFKLDKSEINSGIDIGQDFVNSKSKLILGNEFNIGDGVFNLSNKEYLEYTFSDSEKLLLKPFYTTKEINRYFVDNKNNYWVIYTSSKFKNKDEIIPYPKLKYHLDKFQKIITSDNKPYGLHRTRDEKIFKGEKILSIRKCSLPSFSYVDFDAYVNRTYNIIKSDRINLKYLTSLLNSKLVKFWLKEKGKLQGELFQVDINPLLSIPLIKNVQSNLLEDVDLMLLLNKELKQTSINFIQLLQSKITIEKLTTKLQNWYELKFGEFLKELQKAKVQLSLSQEAEWMQYFNEQKQKAQLLKTEIEKTDKEIDKMVYELYGLSEEEIKIVEEN